MFTIEKDLSGIFWHIYNNARTRVNVSDFDVVIDSVSQTFIVQCKNGSNIPSQAISISLMQVIDLSVGTSPIPFSGADGLIQLLMAKNYTPYLQDAPSQSVVVYRVGQVGVFTMTHTQFTDNFTETGLGRNTMLGWALRNGSNGTKNQQGKFSLNKGAAPYDVIGAIGGSANAVLIGHNHKIAKLSGNFSSLGGTAPVSFRDAPFTVDSDATGLSENGVSVPDQSGVGKNMPPYLIDVWVERVTELVINAGGGGGGGGVQTVTGVNVTGTPTDRVVGVPTLQQVTDEDNETTTAITVKDSESKLSLYQKNITFQDIDGGGNTLLRFEDTEATDQEITIRGLAGTMALTSDIPTLEAGTNITIDDTNPLNLIISASGGGGGIPTLQQVTDEGNTTTSDIIVNTDFNTDSANLASNQITISDVDDYSYLNKQELVFGNNADEELSTYGVNNIGFITTAITSTSVSFENPTSINSILIPDKSGTLATLDDVPTKTSDLINDGDNGTSHFITLEDLPSNLILYPTTVASGIGGYNKLVSSITDPSYNTVAVDVSTGTITGTDQLIAGLITSPNIIVGNPGIFNITTIGNIRKVSGAAQAEFYFTVYKRDAGGTETLILQSSNTPQITSAIYTEFSATGLWNDGIFVSTDMIVMKFYGTKVGSGSSPTYDFQFGGTQPVRTLVPIPLTVVPNLSLDELTDVTIITPTNNQALTYTSATDIWENKTIIEDSIVNGVTDKAPSQNAVFDLFQFTRRLITNGSGSVTGTTAETILTSLTIPANTLDSKCFIWSTMDYFKSSPNACTLRLYINTANTTTGATLIGFASVGSSRNVSFNRKLYLNGTTLDFLSSNTGSSQVSSEFIEAIFGASTTLTVNPANDIFLIYTTQNDAVGTTATGKMATVQKLKLN